VHIKTEKDRKLTHPQGTILARIFAGATVSVPKETVMIGSRSCIFSTVVLAYLAAGAGLAQSQTATPSTPATPPPAATPAPPPTTSAPTPSTMTMQDVSKWTRKQWKAARADWIKDKVKWDGCQSQAKAQKLSGRKSWQVIYNCMTM
jgi:hypothetical protein